MRIELPTAVIAALGSIAGSAVGGGAAYLATKQQQDEEAQRERQRARTIAMLETNRLQTLDRELHIMARDRIYVARGGEIQSDLGSQDLALVVARLTLRQSAALASARECIREGIAALRPMVNTETIE